VACELVNKYDRKRIETKIELYEYLKARESQLLWKNPAGYLRKAIEDDYQAPEGFVTRAQIAAMQKERERQEQAQRWFETDRTYRDWAAMSDEEKAAGQLWVWRLRFKRNNQRDAKPEEIQAQKAEIMNNLPTPEEYRKRLFTEAGVPDTAPRPRSDQSGG
jgi:hypothetical protein